MQNETFSDYVSVRFLPGERARLEELAKSTDRTLSELIRWLCRRAVVTPGADVHLAPPVVEREEHEP